MAAATGSRRVHVSLRLTPAQHAGLQARAEDESRSLTQHVIELIKDDARTARALQNEHAPAPLEPAGGSTKDPLEVPSATAR